MTGDPEQQPDGASSRETAEEDHHPGEFRLPNATAGVYSSTMATVAGSTVAEALSGLVAAGEVPEGVVNRAAREAGIEPAEMAERVETMRAGFEAAVIDRLELPMVDAFSAWAKGDAGRTAEMARAVARMVREGDASGFDGLGRAFKEQLDMVAPREVEAALEASGVPFRRDRNGRLTVRVMGTEMGFRTAVREGLLRVWNGPSD